MDLAEERLEIAFAAWLAAREGKGLVLAGEHYPAAHAMAEGGWLERRFVDGKLAWFWSDEAEHALAVGGLLNDADSRQN